MPESPNFVLILADQWRGDCLSHTGHPVVETPFLDETAKHGTTFTAAYSQAPTCIPARACLATGQTPCTCGRLGYQDGVPWRYEQTMMRLLRDGGYQTLCAGKTHFYPKRAALGFEEMRRYEVNKHDPTFDSDYHRWLQAYNGGCFQDVPSTIEPNAYVVRPWAYPEYTHPNCWTARMAIELLERRDPTRPFFIQVGFQRPHAPMDPPAEYLDIYRGRELPAVPIGDWAHGFSEPVTSAGIRSGRLPSERLDRVRRAYYAQITHLDTQIEAIRYWLSGHGYLENTFIIFTSDHGDMLGDHNMFRKSCFFEGSAHIPLMIVPPERMDAPRGQSCDMPVGLMDVMPTLLDAAALSPADGVQGKSLLPHVRDGSAEWAREFIHGEHVGADGWQMLTDGREKFIWETVSGDEFFFDLTQDSCELHNLAGVEQHAQTVALWRQRLIELLATRPQDELSDGQCLLPGRKLRRTRPALLE